MLIRIAWRNIWRNKVRSLVVICALALGLWAGIFVSGFVNGMMRQKIDSVISLEISHIQFHKPDFRDDMPVSLFMEEGPKIKEELSADPDVKGVSARTISMVMIGSANNNGGVKLTGIVPEDESMVTSLSNNVIEGKYFEGVSRNPILISKVFAEKYKVGLKSKLVVTIQDVEGNLASAAFRVVGIYETGNKMYDQVNAFARLQDVQSLVGIGDGVHEIAVLLNEHELAESKAAQYQNKYTKLEVLPWMDIASGMRYMIEAMGKYTVIIVGIVLLALLFSIVNTMLMAVLERVREIGMLMAVGMAKQKVFKMIMLETIFLSLIGGPLGLFIAWASLYYFGNAGINLGGAAYADYGFASIIYPYLDSMEYVKVTIMVLVMAVLAAIYPARKALKLNPVEAIRKI